MKRTPALALLATLACASPPPLPPCEANTPGVPLAFELHAPDGRTAFLQGSVHFARESEAAIDPRAKQALAQADVLVGELDMENLSPMQVATQLYQMGRLPEGQHLSDVLSPETFALLQQRAKETGTPIEPFMEMKPWVLAMSFLAVALVQSGFTPEEGVELQVYASERPKATRGLETIGDQLRLFDDMSYEAQDHMLRDALKPTDENAIQLDSMFSAWRCGDAPALESVLTGMQAADPDLAPFYEATIFQRNQRMAKGMQAVIAESQHAFIVVGALHLVGARGIPALLEQAGYRVEQLQVSKPPASEPVDAGPPAASP
jgi:uncharacterized protein YbaP (TraB family)